MTSVRAPAATGRRWAGGARLRVSYAPWWFDAGALAHGSLQRRRLEEAHEAGAGPPPPPARPAVASLNMGALPARVWDLLQHWAVEEGSAAPPTEEEALRGCGLDLLGAYGRVWALQQFLQCGLFDLMARLAHAAGPSSGVSGRSFMAAKVASGPRARRAPSARRRPPPPCDASARAEGGAS